MEKASHLSAQHYVAAMMETKTQTLDSVQLAVKGILGRSGCPTCGRIAELRFAFTGDPGPELVKAGVVSLTGHGI